MGTKRSPSGSWCVVGLLSVLLSISAFVHGQVTLTWNLAGEGSWHDPNNWDPNRDRRPTEYDTAIIDQGEAQIVTEDAVAGGVRIGQSPATTGRVLLSNGKTLTVAPLSVGYAGTGTFTQTGGLVTASGAWIGGGSYQDDPSTGVGVYLLSAGSLTTWSGLFVGSTGRGTFLQIGGRVQPAGWMEVGFYSGSFGSYHLCGGTLHPDVSHIGWDSGAIGRFLMTGDSSYLQLDQLFVGYGGMGTFTQTDGLVSAEAVLIGGGTEESDPSTGVGVYLMSGGKLVAIPLVGSTGQGTFLQTGGLVDAGTCIDVGYRSGSFGFYHLSGGTLLCGEYPTIGTDSGARGSLLVTGTGCLKYDNTRLRVGNSGRGTLTQDGDAAVVIGEGEAFVAIGGDGGEGLYELRAGTLVVPTDLKVEACTGSWPPGVGVFRQTGGYNDVRGAVVLAERTGADGRYEFSGGMLLADTLLGGAGRGGFNFTGGTLVPRQVGLFLDNCGGLLAPGGDQVGTVEFTAAGNSTCYSQSNGGTLEITIANVPNGEYDTLVMDGDFYLGGGLVGILLDPTDARPNYRHTEFTIVTADDVVGNFSWSEGRYPYGPVDTTSYDSPAPLFLGHASVSGAECHMEFLGYTMGDINGDCKVDGSDLALMGGNWMQTGKCWGEGNLNDDPNGLVDGSDLALLGKNWMWVCPVCYPGGKDGGGEEAKMDDGGLDLSDRDGDGDFDTDDMLIIIEEMNDGTGDDWDILEPFLDDSAPPPDPNLPPEWTDGQSRSGSPPPPLVAAAMDSPVFWPACWLACLVTLFRAPRPVT